jgi:hypothetical protein
MLDMRFQISMFSYLPVTLKTRILCVFQLFVHLLPFISMDTWEYIVYHMLPCEPYICDSIM